MSQDLDFLAIARRLLAEFTNAQIADKLMGCIERFPFEAADTMTMIIQIDPVRSERVFEHLRGDV